jgi:hypothetical protein
MVYISRHYYSLDSIQYTQRPITDAQVIAQQKCITWIALALFIISIALLIYLEITEE